ncbi:MAG: DUF2306 domain-containing protein [Alphaproteobacteria bacterium]|nr:DUF2306 domain-containing protein [Alphaproteobacteria bacterium]
MTTARELSADELAAGGNAPEQRTTSRKRSQWPERALKYASITWFLAAALGQWIFVFYVALQYIPVLAQTGLPGLENTSLPDGYVPGDTLGNLSIAFHVMVAIVIIGSGPLQLTPQIRNRFPTFHRYVGRAYIALASLTSAAGLYLVWTRGVPGGMAGYIGISLDAALIMLFGGLAMYYAIKRKFVQHRRWAMRLFMVVSAVWFFRIGMMFWFMTTGGIGINPETFEGPFITFVYFGQMAVPLLFLETYFFAQKSKKPAVKSGAALLIFAAAVATLIGVFAASLGMWFPRIL